MKVKLIDVIRAEQSLQDVVGTAESNMQNMLRVKVSAGDVVADSVVDSNLIVDKILATRRLRASSFVAAVVDAAQLRAQLRAIVSVANVNNGISDIIAQRVGLENVRRVVTNATNTASIEPQMPGRIVNELATKDAAARAGSHYHMDASVSVPVLTEEDAKKMKAELASMKRQDVMLKDDLARLNRTAEVEVDDQMWKKVQELVEQGII